MPEKEKFKISHLPGLLKETFKEWMAEDPFAKSAAVAYYAIFSLPGLLLIVVTIIGSVFGEAEARQRISSQVVEMLGKGSAEDIQELIQRAQIQNNSTMATIVGIAILLFGASGLFFQLQKSLNAIWQVQKSKKAGIWVMARDRAMSLGLVIAIGFLLLVSLVLSTLISALNDWITETFSEWISFVTYFINITLSLGIFTLLFASIFKVLPDVEIKWFTVWRGAFITAVLFTLGKLLISYYLSMADPASSFGAAGIVIIILLWVSYTCMIVFLGAEFTQVYARRYGIGIRPSSFAEYTPGYRLKQMDTDG